MITINDVYHAYPNSDLLPIEVTTETMLDDVEDADSLGDTLFLFLCRELCNENDEVELPEAVKRLKTAIHDINAVREAIAFDGKPPHLATLVASHMHSIFTMQPGDSSTFAIADELRLAVQHGTDGVFRVAANDNPSVAVGNAYAVAQSYLERLFSTSQIAVLSDV